MNSFGRLATCRARRKIRAELHVPRYMIPSFFISPSRCRRNRLRLTRQAPRRKWSRERYYGSASSKPTRGQYYKLPLIYCTRRRLRNPSSGNSVEKRKKWMEKEKLGHRQYPANQTLSWQNVVLFHHLVFDLSHNFLSTWLQFLAVACLECRHSIETSPFMTRFPSGESPPMALTEEDYSSNIDTTILLVLPGSWSCQSDSQSWS